MAVNASVRTAKILTNGRKIRENAPEVSLPIRVYISILFWVLSVLLTQFCAGDKIEKN